MYFIKPNSVIENLKNPIVFLKWWKYQKSRSPKNNVFLVTMNHAGTHWLRMLLAKTMINFYRLDDNITDIKAFDLIPPFHRKQYRFKYNHDLNILRIQQSHAVYNDVHFIRGRVVFLIRDLRDALVSHYLSYSARNNPELSFSDYLRGEGVDERFNWTLRRRIHFLNSWGEAKKKKLASIIEVRFEDLKSDTNDTLKNICDFLDWEVSDEDIIDAVNFASRENMRSLEANEPVESNKGKTEKVRKSSLINYQEYYTDADRNYFMDKINNELHYSFQYDYNTWQDVTTEKGKRRC